MAVAMAVLSAWLVLPTLKELYRKGEKQIGLIVALICVGGSAYGIYLTLRTILTSREAGAHAILN